MIEDLDVSSTDLEPYRELGDSPEYFKHDHNTWYDLALTELPAVLCLVVAILSVSAITVFLYLYIHSVHATFWWQWLVTLLVNFVLPLCLNRGGKQNGGIEA